VISFNADAKATNRQRIEQAISRLFQKNRNCLSNLILTARSKKKLGRHPAPQHQRVVSLYQAVKGAPDELPASN
jgi:hypothetical protein